MEAGLLTVMTLAEVAGKGVLSPGELNDLAASDHAGQSSPRGASPDPELLSEGDE